MAKCDIADFTHNVTIINYQTQNLLIILYC